MPAGRTPTLLLTRPDAESRQFAATLPQVPAVISPIMVIVPVAYDAARLAGAEGFVFTSGHAVASAAPGLGRLALCVGQRTAEIAKAAGFSVIEGPGDAEGLVPLIEQSPVRLIHPRGRHVARPLPVEDVVVYDQVARPLSTQAQRLLGNPGIVIAPLFSPRSARLLAEAAGGARASLRVAAISQATLDAWDGPSDRLVCAGTPTAKALTVAICELIRKEQS